MEIDKPPVIGERKMKNKLTDLQNHLFEMTESLNDGPLIDKDPDETIKRALALNELAKTVVANGALMAKCADLLYGMTARAATKGTGINRYEKVHA
jgi:hypothetical protein